MEGYGCGRCHGLMAVRTRVTRAETWAGQSMTAKHASEPTTLGVAANGSSMEMKDTGGATLNTQNVGQPRNEGFKYTRRRGEGMSGGGSETSCTINAGQGLERDLVTSAQHPRQTGQSL